MVKMRVNSNAWGSSGPYVGQVLDFNKSLDGLYRLTGSNVLFTENELDPIEEVAAPTKEELPRDLELEKLILSKYEDTKSETPLLTLPDEDKVFTSDKFIKNISDPVSKPSHYHFSEYEPIKVIQAWDLSFALGNVVKYIARAGRKDSSKLIEDLEKAKRYIELELEHLRK